MTTGTPQFTDQQIVEAMAVERRVHFERGARNEHPDCVRIAAAWLDAQTRLARGHIGSPVPLKHIIEGWGGRYVNTLDVMTAARLLGIKGTYPYIGISGKFVFPSPDRLRDIGQALTQANYCGGYFDRYKRTETGLPVKDAVREYAELLVARGLPPAAAPKLFESISTGFEAFPEMWTKIAFAADPHP
jgi:hypothetical protein